MRRSRPCDVCSDPATGQVRFRVPGTRARLRLCGSCGVTIVDALRMLRLPKGATRQERKEMGRVLARDLSRRRVA